MTTVAYICTQISDQPVFFVDFPDVGNPAARLNLDLLDAERTPAEMVCFAIWMPTLLNVIAREMTDPQDVVEAVGIRREVMEEVVVA